MATTNADGSITFEYEVREVTLLIKTLKGNLPPRMWNWPDIIEVNPDEVEVLSEKHVSNETITQLSES